MSASETRAPPDSVHTNSPFLKPYFFVILYVARAYARLKCESVFWTKYGVYYQANRVIHGHSDLLISESVKC